MAAASPNNRLHQAASRPDKRNSSSSTMTSSSCLCCSCNGCCTCIQQQQQQQQQKQQQQKQPQNAISAKTMNTRQTTKCSPRKTTTISKPSPVALLAPIVVRKSSKLKSSPQELHDDQYKNCAKCLLIARFTTTQARLTAQRQSNVANLAAATNNSNQMKGKHSDRAISEISSLTASSFGGNNKLSDSASCGGGSASSSNWSISSLSDLDERTKNQEKPIVVERENKQSHQRDRNKRKQAPLPPANTVSRRRNTHHHQQQQKQQQKKNKTSKCDRSKKKTSSVDSGNTSETSQSNQFNHKEETSTRNDVNETREEEDEKTNSPPVVNLLSEMEIYSIEHSLRSLKSSTYVCGCLANLYLTNTCLANNGRHSRPTSWQLSRTGVPVLTFDSGLARNRNKRRLCINLAERGSGFILWSDVIDHLSNYRAYSTQVDDASAKPSSRKAAATDAPPTCDTFHVMYLSSNHRLMVGLSFDDAHCARLFLQQVELITSDPANISLSGPKQPLAKRTLASMGRLGQLLVANDSKKNSESTKKESSPSSAKKEPNAPMLISTAASMGCLSYTPAATGANHQEEMAMSNYRSRSTAKLSAAATDGWSTLRKVMKFGQRVGLVSATAAASHFQAPANLSAERHKPWLRPRPLPALAAAGRNFKRLPRKCDISAPCLFEHVTRVDSLNLEQMYSRSLVVEDQLTRTDANNNNNNNSNNNNNNQRVADETTDETDRLSRSMHNLAAPNNQNDCQMVANRGMISHEVVDYNHGITATTRSKESKDRSASSSCYSSASISPASSDESAADLRVSTPQVAAIRSAPPIPPTRRASREEIQLSNQVNRHSTMIDQQTKNDGAGKVKAMIRELQSQASSDLVDAKRLLMADIAAQAKARLSRSVSHL